MLISIEYGDTTTAQFHSTSIEYGEYGDRIPQHNSTAQYL